MPGIEFAALEIAPASATARLQRLAELGLVSYEPYRGVALTEDGRRAAAAAMRRHRIVERFLSDMLGYRWEDADRLAVAFEHDLPAEVVNRLFVALDRPETCPHGFPIPERDSDDVPALPSLDTLEPGTDATVALPGATAPDVAAFLDTLGVRPGAQIHVRERHPFDGPVVVSVAGEERTVGNKLARQILALLVGGALMRSVLAAETGTPGMRSIAAAIQGGRRTCVGSSARSP